MLKCFQKKELKSVTIFKRDSVIKIKGDEMSSVSIVSMTSCFPLMSQRLRKTCRQTIEDLQKGFSDKRFSKHIQHRNLSITVHV